jgi:hypothetical protein
MTICVGILASDGIVIAADAEESDTYFKRSQQKILTWNTLQLNGNSPTQGPGACVLAGAGDAGFIDAFSHFLLSSVTADLTMQSFEKYVATQLETFYGKHVIPLIESVPNADFQMLIGASFGFSTALFVTYRSTVRRARPNAAIGIGGSFALRQMDEFPFCCDVRTTEIVAANIVATTKDCIEGCGKYTDIVSIHNCSFIEGKQPGEGSHLEHPQRLVVRVSPLKIAQWERNFGTTWAKRQRILTQELIADELRNEKESHEISERQQLDNQTIEGL